MAGAVSAVLVPDVEYLFDNAAELGAVLGVKLGAVEPQAGRKQSDRGILVHPLRPGHESLGVRFFDWEQPQGKGYQVGTLRPAAEIAAFVLGRKLDPDLAADKGEALASRILINVEKFRKATEG